MTTLRRSGRCLVAICVVALTSCAKGTSGAAQPPPTVKVVSATTRTIHPIVALSGIIAPLQNVALTTSLQEPTDAVLVNEGDYVREGQALARLNTADLTASADQARAHLEQTQYQGSLAISQGSDQVRSAQAALDQAKENLSLSQITLTRDEQLLTQGYIAQQTVDQQRTQVEVNLKAVDSAAAALAAAKENQAANGTQSAGMQKANIDQAAASLEQAQVQISKADILSPVNGIVVNRNLNPGEYPGTRQIFTLQEVDNVYAELNAYGSQVAAITQGAPVSVTTPAIPNHRFAGRVVAVLSPATPTTSGFIVKVKFPNPGQLLKPGIAVTGNVTGPAQRGIAIPVNAFLDDTHQTVITVTDGIAHVANVTEIAEDPRYAVVTGLPHGIAVLANGQTNVVDGEKVAVR